MFFTYYYSYSYFFLFFIINLILKLKAKTAKAEKEKAIRDLTNLLQKKEEQRAALETKVQHWVGNRRNVGSELTLSFRNNRVHVVEF